jgi:hypothetical protein
MGVALFSGLKPSGGHAADILGVERRGCLTVVRFSERSPGPDSIVTKILTTPWAVATVAVSEYPVVFERAGGSGGTPLIPLEEASRVAQAKEACGSTLVN